MSEDMRCKLFVFLFTAMVMSLFFFVHWDASLNAIEKNLGNSQKKQVIATVNGEPITLDDYYKAQKIPPSHLHKDMHNSKLIKRYLERMIEHKLLEQEAFQLGLNNDPAIILLN